MTTLTRAVPCRALLRGAIADEIFVIDYAVGYHFENDFLNAYLELHTTGTYNHLYSPCIDPSIYLLTMSEYFDLLFFLS